MKVLRGLLACSVGPRLHQDRHGDVKASFLNSAPTLGGGGGGEQYGRVVVYFDQRLGTSHTGQNMLFQQLLCKKLYCHHKSLVV